MKTLSYGSAVGTFVQVSFVSQVKQLAASLTGAGFEALSFQEPARKLKVQVLARKHARPSKATSPPEVPC